MSVSDQPSRLRFGGHNTFPMRSGWLKKFSNFLESASKKLLDKGIEEKEIMLELGVGRNMVKSIEFWSIATHVMKRKDNSYVLTDFGKALLTDLDPYLERLESIWMLHYNLTQSFHAGIWNVVFSHIPHEVVNLDLTLTILGNAVSAGIAKPVAISTSTRDYNCLINSYVKNQTQKKIDGYSLDCPFKELNLISRHDSNECLMKRSSRINLSPWVFLISLKKYFVHYHGNKSYTDLDTLLYGTYSPGMVFRLSKEGLIELCDRISTYQDVSLEISSTSGIQQIHWQDMDDHDPLDLLRRAYE